MSVAVGLALVVLALAVLAAWQWRRTAEPEEHTLPSIKEQYPPQVVASFRLFGEAMNRRSIKQWQMACHQSLERSRARRGRR